MKKELNEEDLEYLSNSIVNIFKSLASIDKVVEETNEQDLFFDVCGDLFDIEDDLDTMAKVLGPEFYKKVLNDMKLKINDMTGPWWRYDSLHD